MRAAEAAGGGDEDVRAQLLSVRRARDEAAATRLDLLDAVLESDVGVERARSPRRRRGRRGRAAPRRGARVGAHCVSMLSSSSWPEPLPQHADAAAPAAGAASTESGRLHTPVSGSTNST